MSEADAGFFEWPEESHVGSVVPQQRWCHDGVVKVLTRSRRSRPKVLAEETARNDVQERRGVLLGTGNRGVLARGDDDNDGRHVDAARVHEGAEEGDGVMRRLR